jgi:N-acetylneuraminic acid mutarotase
VSRARLSCLATAMGLVVAVAASARPSQWEERAPLPLARTEVAGAAFGNEVAIVGGYTSEGAHSARVDAYSPARDHWRRLPDLPVTVHHAMAVGNGRQLYVLGGYGEDGRPRRTAFVFDDRRWRALPLLPFPRAAAGAAVVRERIVVVGGVVRVTGRRLARSALSFDLRSRRWSLIPGPTPREHLGVAALGGAVYAVAGRLSGLDTNLATFESWRPGATRWTSLPPVPKTRGGTGAVGLAGRVVSVGGEEPGGTIEEVYAYRAAARSWEPLPDLPTPRHGLGAAALGGRVFVIGGGPQPGLTVSAANETFAVGG